MYSDIIHDQENLRFLMETILDHFTVVIYIFSQLYLLHTVMQTENIFKGSKGPFVAVFTLDQEKVIPVLTILLTNTLNNHVIHLQVDEDYINAQDSRFTDNISSVSELYDHLVADFDSLSFTEEGSISFEIEVMIKKKVKRKVYTIRAQKVQVVKVEQISRKLDDINKKMKEDSEEKNRRIFELEERLTNSEREYQRQISQLKKEMRSQKQQFNLLKTSNSDLLEQLMKVREDLEGKRELKERSQGDKHHQERQIKFADKQKIERARIDQKVVEDHEQQIEEVIQANNKNPQKVQKIRKQQKQGKQPSIKQKQNQGHLKRRERLEQLQMHPENPKKGSFIVKEEQYSLIISKFEYECQDTYYIGAKELEKGKTTSFKMKQVKTQSRMVMLGIGTINTFGISYLYNHRQSVFYYSLYGIVYESGTSCGGGKPVDDGSILSMDVDMSASRVEWSIDGKYQATAKISQEMQSFPLFLFIMLWKTGDQVHLLL